ncbi:6615_t:CDS:1 [Ambispora leptoticha]|uniref:6615_t:CDS:1 n=1 Tax=Ambispora leptoticha TaxID=144679 RepID=A0A9N9A4K1_9GLOM|nr:6615_t:CDS:1 [Ambispora leptoticha]
MRLLNLSSLQTQKTNKMTTILSDKNLEIDDPSIKQYLDLIEPHLKLSIELLIEPKIMQGKTPPRPPNAWILYNKNFQAWKGQNLSAVTTSPKASLNWKGLTKDERHAWTLLGQIAKQKHKKLYPTYQYKPNKFNKHVEATGKKKPGPKKGHKKDTKNNDFNVFVFSWSEQKRKSDSLGDQIKNPEPIIQNPSNNFEQQDELNINIIQQNPMIDNDGVYYSHITTVNEFSENLFSESDHSSSFISNYGSFCEYPPAGPLSSITDIDTAYQTFEENLNFDQLSQHF